MTDPIQEKRVDCGACGSRVDEVFAALASGGPATCPNCGAKAGFRVSIVVEEVNLAVEDSVSFRSPQKTSRVGGRRRPLIEGYARWDVFHKTGKKNWRAVSYDRSADEYHEVITDRDGNTLHETHEKLSEHRDHGSARPKERET
jgi:hypothetical protein